MSKNSVRIMGIVNEVVTDFVKAMPEVKVPKPYRDGQTDKRGSVRVEIASDAQALEMGTFIWQAREWASVAGVFKDAARKALVRQHTLRIANEFAELAGADAFVSVSARTTKVDGEEGRRMELPTTEVTDLEDGDEVQVVRHLTRWGLDTYESFPARVKGRAANGDYWITSLADGTSRACRTTEVIVTKRAKAAA